MLVIRSCRGALQPVLAIPMWFILALALQAAEPPTSATQARPDRPPSITPLPMDELGPRTLPVELAVYPNVRYVSATAPPHATGERDNPWASPAEALAAITDAGPDRRYAVLVAAGDYALRGLQLKPYVDLYGGFSPRDWTRDIVNTPSVFDGRQAGPLLLGADHARIDGFVLHNGCATEPGGAVVCRETSPWFSNNVFTANRTRAAGRSTMSVGAIPATPPVAPGGAIACLGRAARPLIERNIFAFNMTDSGDGGAVACLADAEATIQFNVFTGNIAGLAAHPPGGAGCGGAIACESGAAAQIYGNLIVNNLAGDRGDGGGIFIGNTRPLRILRNVIAGNQAGGSGGGILADAPADFIFASNAIAGNTAAAGGGGVFFAPGCEGILDNCLVSGNKALDGGGITADGATLRLTNCTVCLNQGEYGGGLLCINSRQVAPQGVWLANSIFGFNNPLSDIFLDERTTSMTVTFCDAGEAWEGMGNISRDPRLAADGMTGLVASMEFNPRTYQTRLVLVVSEGVRYPLLRGRMIHLGLKNSVIASQRQQAQADRMEVWVWGDMPGGGLNRPPISFEIRPTYGLLPDSPCIDAGDGPAARQDLYGNPRLIRGRDRPALDLGAVEFIPPPSRINPLIPDLPPPDS